MRQYDRFVDHVGGMHDIWLFYTNPWPSFSPPGIKDVLKATQLKPHADKARSVPGEPVPAVAQPDFSPLKPESMGPRFMWLGHASVYLQLPYEGGMFNILFDPVFSDRCSPIPWLGPKRRVGPPCRVEDLPGVDGVVISHDHYDHLDKRSIVDIEHHFPGVRYVCPSGLARWFVKLGIDAKRVTELGWWEAMDLASPLTSVKESEDGDDQVQSALAERPEAVISPKDSSETLVPSPTTINPTSSTSTKVAQRRIRLVCCPAQHNSGRSLLSRNKTLWASWYLIHEGLGTDKDRNTRVYFGGDTGYRSKAKGPVCPIFEDTATRLGPPDVAFLPIAAGSVLPFLETLFPITINHAITSSVHMTPQDAVEVSRVLKARKSVGIHWGTFTTDRQARETARQVREQDGIIGEGEKGGVVLPVIGAWEAIETSDGKALSCLGL